MSRAKKNGSKSAMKIAKKALKKVNKIEKAIELKFYDFQFNDNAVDWDGSLEELNEPPQGLGDQDRIGDKITAVSDDMRYTIVRGEVDAVVRIILVWDKQNTLVDITNVLQLPTTNSTVNSAYTKDKRGEYIVLWDRSFALTAARTYITVHKFRKINKNTQFENGGQDISTGALKIFYLSDVDPIMTAAEKPNVRIYSRLLYSDS